ncbi:MAG: glycosyltransferase, partial [Caldilineae bacterium]
VIPVWNGADVIEACLHAVYTHSGAGLREVICVDNASGDASVQVIQQAFPQVRLLRQPINLGFAGGVNAGMRAAAGDVIVLLNQDCLVQPGWLDALLEALDCHPDWGIVGATICTSDGQIHHAGARIQFPLALGVHDTQAHAEERTVDYVTGAVFALRRDVWRTVGALDEGFYPAYYEESDYCYRARRHGYLIGYAPKARAVHLFSNQEWRQAPLRHAVNQHRMRFRFVAKHWDADALTAFFAAESQQIETVANLDDLFARLFAARLIRFSLPDILQRRRQDLALGPDADPEEGVRARVLTNGFSSLVQQTLESIQRHFQTTAPAPVTEPESLRAHEEQLEALDERLERLMHTLHDLQVQQEALLQRIYFRPVAGASPQASWLSDGARLVKRALSFFSGREFRLQARLSTLHTYRLNLVDEILGVQAERARIQEQLRARQMHLLTSQWTHELTELRQNVRLLERLHEYDVL